MAEEEEDIAEESALRSFWTGSITFGLVNVPVAIYTATRARGVSLRMLAPDRSPVRRRYVCSADGKVLDADDIVRGYEIEKGKYVIVTDEELEAVEPRKSREIDLRLFVDRDAIPPIFFERAWFLVPSGGTNKAYRLLAAVMEKKKQAGIATFVMRAKEYLVAIIAENGILRAETLRFANEVRTPEDVGLPESGRTPAAEVKKFETQIGKHTGRLNVKELVDDYTARLEKLVASKERKGTDVVRVDEEEETSDRGAGGEVVDLLAILSRSLAGGSEGRKPAQTAARKATAKRPAKKSVTRAAATSRKK